MKLVKHLANLGYGSRKEVQWMFREGRITDAAGEVMYADDPLDHDNVRVDGEPLDLYEADARALALAGENLADARVPVSRHWHDVAAGVAERFDAIVCNPPFHALGRGDRPDIGRAFIAAAAQALKPRGSLWLVANRHLPYEDALGTGFAATTTLKQEGGFKIVHAVKA